MIKKQKFMEFDPWSIEPQTNFTNIQNSEEIRHPLFENMKEISLQEETLEETVSTPYAPFNIMDYKVYL